MPYLKIDHFLRHETFRMVYCKNAVCFLKKTEQIMHLFLTQCHLKDTFQDCILRHQSSNLMTLEINPFTAFTQKNPDSTTFC